MIRLAQSEDLEAIEAIYDAILDLEEAGEVSIGWVRGVYPTRSSAQEALDAGDLFVELSDDGEVVAAARINQIQVPEYADASWEFEAPDDEVMVLHTLTVHPAYGGKSYGKKFVEFYEQYALDHCCKYLRMDTNAVNSRARAMYAKLGYNEADIVPCVFNGIPGVQLVCLEKYLKD